MFGTAGEPQCKIHKCFEVFSYLVIVYSVSKVAWGRRINCKKTYNLLNEGCITNIEKACDQILFLKSSNNKYVTKLR